MANSHSVSGKTVVAHTPCALVQNLRNRISIHTSSGAVFWDLGKIMSSSAAELIWYLGSIFNFIFFFVNYFFARVESPHRHNRQQKHNQHGNTNTATPTRKHQHGARRSAAGAGMGSAAPQRHERLMHRAAYTSTSVLLFPKRASACSC